MTTCNPTHPPLRRQTAPSTAPMPDARPWRRGQAPQPRSGAPKAQGLKATIAVAASSPAPSVTQANLANLNSAAAEVPMNAAVTSQIYTSLTDTTKFDIGNWPAGPPKGGRPLSPLLLRRAAVPALATWAWETIAPLTTIRANMTVSIIRQRR